MEKGVQNIPERIAILGPESSGKTTLAEELAEILDYTLIPEFARRYLSQEENGGYSLEEVLFMLEMQFQSIQECEGPVIADTEMITFLIWSNDKFNSRPDGIDEKISRQQFDLYLLCYPDLDWEEDPLREDPGRRPELFEEYHTILKEYKMPFFIVKGEEEERLASVLTFIGAKY